MWRPYKGVMAMDNKTTQLKKVFSFALEIAVYAIMAIMILCSVNADYSYEDKTEVVESISIISVTNGFDATINTDSSLKNNLASFRIGDIYRYYYRDDDGAILCRQVPVDQTKIYEDYTNTNKARVNLMCSYRIRKLMVFGKSKNSKVLEDSIRE